SSPRNGKRLKPLKTSGVVGVTAIHRGVNESECRQARIVTTTDHFGEFYGKLYSIRSVAFAVGHRAIDRRPARRSCAPRAWLQRTAHGEPCRRTARRTWLRDHARRRAHRRCWSASR